MVAATVAVVALALLVAIGLRARRARARADSAAAGRALAEGRLAGVLAAGRDGILVHTRDGHVTEVSAAAAELFGTDMRSLVGTRVDHLPVRWRNDDGEEVVPSSVFAPRTAPVASSPDEAPGAPGLVLGVDRGVGEPRWVQVTTRPLPGGPGDPELVTVLTDVTGPREVRAALARSERQFQAAMENAPIGMALADPSWRLEQVNPAFAALLGADAASLVGRDLSSLSHPADRALERAQVQEMLAGARQRFTLEKRYVRADGQTVWGVLDAVLVRNATGAPDHVVLQLRDVTESRMQSELLAHRAMHDSLTGLANRARMHEVLEHCLGEPDAAGRVAVLAIDLDEFKQINDRYGHAAGDEVLVHVAGVLRAATAGRGTPARLGGDEFVVVIRDPDAARVVFEVSAGIHQGLRDPVRTERRRLPVRASVGIAVADTALVRSGPMGLLAAADAALYRAKAAGRGRSEVYDASMTMSAPSKHGVAAELGEAIERGQLVLHYQSVVDLGTGAVVGQEALVRWQHPERGLLLPGSFLPTAEETGLGAALGGNVMTQAAAYLARTQEAGRWLSVNVSADQLGDGELVARILAEVERFRVAPGRLVVELTEASLGDSSAHIRHELGQLRQAGVPVVLDDFGTGVNPLSSLRDLPVTGVKLDMSYTAGIPEDPAAARVSRALGSLARELELVTIASGIETEEQARVLHGCGWRFGQGWLFGAGESEPLGI
nr:EAL domain-containing protein [Cellulomonas sp. APG4]